MAEMTVGKGALLTNKFMRKTYTAAARSYVEYERPLPVSSWSTSGVTPSSSSVTPAPRRAAGARTTPTSPGSRSPRDEWLKDKDTQVGQVIKCQTIKNKTAPPRRTGQVDFYFEDANGHFAGDYDTIREVYDLALLHDIIERHGAWFHFGDEKWNGKDAVWKAMGDDQAIVDALDIRVRTEVLGLAPPAPAQLNPQALHPPVVTGVGEAGEGSRQAPWRCPHARQRQRMAAAQRRAGGPTHPVGGQADQWRQHLGDAE